MGYFVRKGEVDMVRKKEVRVYLSDCPFEILHLSFLSVSCLMLLKIWVAALREEVASYSV